MIWKSPSTDGVYKVVVGMLLFWPKKFCFATITGLTGFGLFCAARIPQNARIESSMTIFSERIKFS